MRWIRRIGMLFALAVPTFLASPATAATSPDVSLDTAQKNTTAEDFSTAICQFAEDLLKNTKLDVLVFDAPGDSEFKHVTVRFADKTVEIPGDDAEVGFVDGHHQVWVAVPEGWELLDGTAEVEDDEEGDEESFVAQMCEDLFAAVSAGNSTAPSGNPTSADPSGVAGVSSVDPSDPASVAGVNDRALAVTGVPTSLIGGAGAVMLAAGGVLLVAVRRRRATKFTA